MGAFPISLLHLANAFDVDLDLKSSELYRKIRDFPHNCPLLVLVLFDMRWTLILGGYHLVTSLPKFDSIIDGDLALLFYLCSPYI